MKKILLLATFLGLTLIYASGQTYYYKHIENVDKNGARSKANGGMYISFSKKSCYESDEDGYKVSGANVYQYKGTKDNLFIFEYDAFAADLDVPFGQLYANAISDDIRYFDYYFSSDYSRMNKPMALWTEVYVKTEMPKKDAEPTHFY